MARVEKKRKSKFPDANKNGIKQHPALDKLEERLSAPRLRAPGTLASYRVTGSGFLSKLKPGQVPTDSDFRQYFIRRRHEGISERTLRKEFFHIKKLALANGWHWPFEKDDTPYPEDEAQSHPLQPEQIEQMIKVRGKLSTAERFYLAVATTWIVRREDLSRIKKRDFDDKFFTIHHSKHGRVVKHLIPDELKPIFAEYRPKEHNPSALSLMFRRIATKAGIKLQPNQGWHGIRHTLTTMLAVALPQNKFEPALIADYSGWSRKSMGGFFGGVPMVGLYRHPEILDTDPHGIDHVIYSIHPFLSLWGKKR
jgi:integrase